MSPEGEAPICVTCGTQFPPGREPPALCPICDEPRQYIPPGGQSWTSMAGMKPKHRNSFRHYEPGLIGIGTEPHFAIGQRAMLIRTPHGNVLWDCISFLDEATAEVVHALGGIAAIAISHPHFYSSMVDWSHEFGNAPIHLHEADRQWVMRPDPAIRFWSGASEQVMDGITLFNTGGHFEGATVLHWRDGASGRGALFTGDVVTVAADRRQATFMRSYPNYIPLPAAKVARIAAMLKAVPFERVYGGWWDSVMPDGGHEAVQRSASRYIDAVSG